MRGMGVIWGNTELNEMDNENIFAGPSHRPTRSAGSVVAVLQLRPLAVVWTQSLGYAGVFTAQVCRAAPAKMRYTISNVKAVVDTVQWVAVARLGAISCSPAATGLLHRPGRTIRG